jgi:hypothetical protein
VTLRRNTLIAACAFGLAMVIGLVAERRDAAQTLLAEQQAKPVAMQPRMPEGATKGSSAYPQIAAPAPGVDSTAAKPVIINVVTPWIQIARMPQYVQASSAERKAIRDLYWHSCVEEQIPLAQRISAYWQFVLDWESTESDGSEVPTRTTSVSQYPREEQAVAPSPVNAGTMWRWCKS